MKALEKGCFVKLINNVIQYGKIFKAGTTGIITDLDNSTVEVVTEENCFVYCTKQDLRKMKLIPYDEALETLKRFCGHHCKSSDRFQFNIKVYRCHIPDIVTDLCKDDEMWDRYYEILNENLECFIVHNCDYGLSYIIPWLGNKPCSDW